MTQTMNVTNRSHFHISGGVPLGVYSDSEHGG